MTEGPYYIVIEGTNICDRTVVDRHTYIPKIFDTKEIAQTGIDESVNYRKRLGLKPLNMRVPISIEEYNKKYAKWMRTNED